MQENNSTTNTVLVILLVIVVGFVVWFVTIRKAPAPDNSTENTPAVNVNLGGNANPGTPASY